MSKNDNALQKLIAGGLIGAFLGAWMSKDEEEGAVIGAILGAAISSTLKANEAAKKTNQPVYIVEDGIMYQVLPNNEKVFIKKLPELNQKWGDNFKLK